MLAGASSRNAQVGKTRPWETMLALTCAAMLALVPRAAHAHVIGLSSGEYAAKGTTLHAKLSFARADMVTLVPSVDANRDGHVTALELHEAREAIASRVKDRIEVRADGAGPPCPSLLLDVSLTELDGLLLAMKAECPAAATHLAVKLAVLDDLPAGHKHVARAVSGESIHDEVLVRGHAPLVVPVPAAAPAASKADRQPSGRGVAGFFAMGMEHILTGWDHLVFLFGLVLVRARVRDLVWVVSAFTVAHSITLALAVLGVFAPSSRIVEPAIGLSIAYVGIENFFLTDPRKRWRITFPFGLVHGFGFASALAELRLDRARIPSALVSFNLGVEIGQLAVIAALVGLVALARKRIATFDPRGVRVLSAGVAVTGVVLAIVRLV